jgi:hypothetical protein
MANPSQWERRFQTNLPTVAITGSYNDLTDKPVAEVKDPIEPQYNFVIPQDELQQIANKLNGLYMKVNELTNSSTIFWELMYPTVLTSTFRIHQLTLPLTDTGLPDGAKYGTVDTSGVVLTFNDIVNGSDIAVNINQTGYLFTFKNGLDIKIGLFNSLTDSRLNAIPYKAFIGRFNKSNTARQLSLSCNNGNYVHSYYQADKSIIKSAMAVSLFRTFLWFEDNKQYISSELPRTLSFEINPGKSYPLTTNIRNVNSGAVITLGNPNNPSPKLTTPFSLGSTIVGKYVAQGRYYSGYSQNPYSNIDDKVKPSPSQEGRLPNKCGVFDILINQLFPWSPPSRDSEKRGIKYFNFPNPQTYDIDKFKLPLSISDCYQLKYYLTNNPNYLSFSTIDIFTADPAVAGYPSAIWPCVTAQRNAELARVKTQLLSYLNLDSNVLYNGSSISNITNAEKQKYIAVFDFPNETDSGKPIGSNIPVVYNASISAIDPNLNYDFPQTKR